jgi:hypothetical protein
MHAIKDENATKFSPPPAAIPKIPPMKSVAWIPCILLERNIYGPNPEPRNMTYVERHLSPYDIGQDSPSSRTHDHSREFGQNRILDARWIQFLLYLRKHDRQALEPQVFTIASCQHVFQGYQSTTHYLLAILGHSGRRAAIDKNRIQFCPRDQSCHHWWLKKKGYALLLHTLVD